MFRSCRSRRGSCSSRARLNDAKSAGSAAPASSTVEDAPSGSIASVTPEAEWWQERNDAGTKFAKAARGCTRRNRRRKCYNMPAAVCYSCQHTSRGERRHVFGRLMSTFFKFVELLSELEWRSKLLKDVQYAVKLFVAVAPLLARRPSPGSIDRLSSMAK